MPKGTSEATIKSFRELISAWVRNLDHGTPGQIYDLCPFHDDNNASLSADLDAAKWTCHGCSLSGGLKEFRDSLRACLLSGDPRYPAPTDCYDYCDEEGRLLFQVWRWDDFPLPGEKAFEAGISVVGSDGRQQRRRGTKGVRRVLYRLPEVLAADTVIIAEGEKCADCLSAALRGCGERMGEEQQVGSSPANIAVTTCPWGAGSWQDAYNEYLRGKAIVILPDNDLKGQQHALKVAQLLPVAASVRIVDLPGLPEKGDIVDWLDADHTISELKHIIESTPGLTTEALAAMTSKPDNAESTGTAQNAMTLPKAVAALKRLGLSHQFWLNAWDGKVYRESEAITDANYLQVAYDLHQATGLASAKERVWEAMTYLANQNKQNPLTAWLGSLEWDSADWIGELCQKLLVID
jgi:hypothetical protein